MTENVLLNMDNFMTDSFLITKTNPIWSLSLLSSKSDIFFVWKTRLCHGIIYVIYIITNAFTKTRSIVNLIYLQGDPNQNCHFLWAITQKLCMSEFMLVKPKSVSAAEVVYNFSKKTKRKIPPLTCILALPTWGQTC